MTVTSAAAEWLPCFRTDPRHRSSGFWVTLSHRLPLQSSSQGPTMLEIGLVDIWGIVNTVAVVSACFFGWMETKNAIFFFDVQVIAAKAAPSSSFVQMKTFRVKQKPENLQILISSVIFVSGSILGGLGVCWGQGQVTRVLSGAGLIPVAWILLSYLPHFIYHKCWTFFCGSAKISASNKHHGKVSSSMYRTPPLNQGSVSWDQGLF